MLVTSWLCNARVARRIRSELARIRRRNQHLMAIGGRRRENVCAVIAGWIGRRKQPLLGARLQRRREGESKKERHKTWAHALKYRAKLHNLKSFAQSACSVRSGKRIERGFRFGHAAAQGLFIERARQFGIGAHANDSALAQHLRIVALREDKGGL